MDSIINNTKTQTFTKERVIEYLKTNYSTSYDSDNNIWIFKLYGFAIKEPPSSIITNSNEFWDVTYIDPPLGIGLDKEENRARPLKCDDVIRILEGMKIIFSAPNNDNTATKYNIYHKPYNILTLEKLTGKMAKLHPLHFAKWHIRSRNEFSIVNNPYGLSLGYSKSKDDFELFFDDERTNPEDGGIYPYLSVITVCEYLLKKKFTIKCNVCGKTPQMTENANGVLLLKICTRCKETRYCSDECQKTDSANHKKNCFIRPEIRIPIIKK